MTSYYITTNPDTLATEIVSVHSVPNGYEIRNAYTSFVHIDSVTYKTQRGVDGWLKKHEALSLDDYMSPEQALKLWNDQRLRGGDYIWLYALIEKANG